MPADYPTNRESPYMPTFLPASMFGLTVQLCRRCGALLPPSVQGDITAEQVHDQMHDTLDSIAAILEQHREVMDRDGTG
jgi:hypothetical protein